jgi:phosphoribosylglycinamide formyltransferase 1
MRNTASIAIFASGDGSNAEEIIQYFKGHPAIEVAVVFSNNPQAYVLVRAKKLGIATVVFSKQQFNEPELMLRWLAEKDVSHIVLAGFLWLIPPYLTKTFPDRIINIHPALLPKHGGKGMYGMKVHEAVRESNETETGITIHLVNTQYDEGRILFQARCHVEPGDSTEQIAQKVHLLEYESYSKIIERWIQYE